MYLIEQFQPIIDAFEKILRALSSICDHIENDLGNLPVWVMSENGDNFIKDKNRVIYALKHFSPVTELTPQETFSCPGAVGATLKTFSYIDALNKAKDSFKNKVREYHHLFKANPTKPVRKILAQAGYGGVKLKQVYRHIQYIDFHPKRIAWSKTTGGRYQVIKAAYAEKMLQKIGKERHINIQLNKLSSLKNNEKLVIYHPIKPHWSVNISTFEGYTDNRRLRQISLPLFYLYDKKLPKPVVCFSKTIKQKNKFERADKKIESVPFLKSINVYKYKIFNNKVKKFTVAPIN
jgi:hypothetical protein